MTMERPMFPPCAESVGSFPPKIAPSAGKLENAPVTGLSPLTAYPVASCWRVGYLRMIMIRLRDGFAKVLDRILERYELLAVRKNDRLIEVARPAFNGARHPYRP
jgi:hypothetical protein